MKRRSLIKASIGALLLPFIPKVLRGITPDQPKYIASFDVWKNKGFDYSWTIYKFYKDGTTEIISQGKGKR